MLAKFSWDPCPCAEVSVHPGIGSGDAKPAGWLVAADGICFVHIPRMPAILQK